MLPGCIRPSSSVRGGALALLVGAAVEAGGDRRADRQRGQPPGLLGEPGGRRLAVTAAGAGAGAGGLSGDEAAQPPGHAVWPGPGADGELAAGAGGDVKRPAVHYRVGAAAGVADADPLAGVHRLDDGPGDVVHTERVHDGQAVAVLDHPRPQRERVGQAGDQQQDGREERAEARRRQPLEPVVDDVDQHERHPHPPEDDRWVQAEGSALGHPIKLCARAGRARRRAGRRRCWR